MTSSQGSSGCSDIRIVILAAGVVAVLAFDAIVACGVMIAAAPHVIDGFEGANVRGALADIERLDHAVEVYAIMQGGRVPESVSDLQQILGSEGPPDVLDPWETPYQLAPRRPGELGPRVVSLGRDGRPGGFGWAADLDREDACKAGSSP